MLLRTSGEINAKILVLVLGQGVCARKLMSLNIAAGKVSAVVYNPLGTKLNRLLHTSSITSARYAPHSEQTAGSRALR